MRSRLRLGGLVLACALLVGCADHFGPGLAELAAGTGWEPLPIQSWVVNDGVNARAMTYCPGPDCLRPAVAAILVVEGGEADALERALAQSPADLARRFAKPTTKAKTPQKVASRTSVTRFAIENAAGIVVDIRAVAGGRLASTGILYARDGANLVVAVAVTNDSQAARDYVTAAWASR